MQSSLAKGLADDIALYSGGYAMPLGKNGALGFALNYLDMGEQEGTDENGDPTCTFRSYMMAFTTTYGVRLNRTLCVGIGVKDFRDPGPQLVPIVLGISAVHGKFRGGGIHGVPIDRNACAVRAPLAHLYQHGCQHGA